MSTEVL
jgi:hypothetical protein